MICFILADIYYWREIPHQEKLPIRVLHVGLYVKKYIIWDAIQVYRMTFIMSAGVLSRSNMYNKSPADRLPQHEKVRLRGLWCFPWCYSKQIVEQTIEFPVILDVMTFMWRHSDGWYCHMLLFTYVFHRNLRSCVFHQTKQNFVLFCIWQKRTVQTSFYVPYIPSLWILLLKHLRSG